MATEITCVVRHPLHPSHIEALGGAGWLADTATVIGEIESGREYYVRRGDALISLSVVRRNGRRRLITDPTASPEDPLLALPRCSRVRFS